MKYEEEQENHEYVRISETASSFNQQVYGIITDKLTNVYSFLNYKRINRYKENLF